MDGDTTLAPELDVDQHALEREIANELGFEDWP